MSPIDPTIPFDLSGRVAVVTGASSGLGARFARVLDAAGASVVVTARRAERLDALAADLRDGVAIAADLAEPGAAGSIVDTACERFGHLDVLVNNAGAGSDLPAVDLPVDDFRGIVEVNLVAPFALAQAAARVMLERGSGSIVNIASQFGLVGTTAGLSAYAAAKGGLVNLTRHLAAEWSPRGVRVNALAPGYFATEMTQDVFEDERFVAWTTRNTPMRRTGREGELDGALLYLASDASSYTTGSVLVVDGGWTAI
jgi:NAD(P)-dependent dehydrogenase (short-subunit alcohol dehydrogenase family)